MNNAHHAQRLLVLILLTQAALVGCTTFSKKQCEDMDWAGQGYQTALGGKPVQEGFNYYQKACKEVDVKLTQSHGDAFAKGYDSGIAQFCTSENAIKFASGGGVYRGTCPDKTVTPKFMASYQTGRETYLMGLISNLEQEVSALKRQVQTQASEISSLQGRTCNP